MALGVWFRLRHSMAAVGVVAFLSWFVLRRDTDTQQSRAIGNVKVQLDFRVRALDSGLPIEGAKIFLADQDWISDPEEPYVLDLKTRADGATTKVVDLRFYESRGIPSGRLRSFRVAYPRWEMKVEAVGYQDSGASFADFEARDRRFHEHRKPPPIIIHLRKLPR